MAIDPTTDIGKLRLRVADFQDIPFLPDSVYQATLEETEGNLQESTKICANYILGMLSLKTHKKLVQMEVWGGEAFTQYKEFLLLSLTNPAFMDYTALPYLVTGEKDSPIKVFSEQWNCISDGLSVDQRMTDITGYGYPERSGEV